VSDGRLERFLNRFADVRGREARLALTFSGYFFLVTFTFYLLKPVKESTLISDLSPAWWPYADLVSALLIGFVVALNVRLLARMPRRTYLTASLLFFIAGLLVFWYVFDAHRTWRFQTPVVDPSGNFFFLWAQFAIRDAWRFIVIAFAFWTDVFIAMSVTQFWISVNDVFDPHQAKRLVGLFVTGGLFGGIIGSAGAALVTLAGLLHPEDLLLVAPGLLALAVATVNFVYAGQRRVDATAGEGPVAGASRVGLFESFRAVRGSRYLRLLAGMLAAAMVAGALINYQFKQSLKYAFETKDAQTAFIAGLFLVILAISTIAHVAATGRVLKTYGIRWAISIAPAVLFLGSLAVFIVPAGLLLAWAMAVRGGDKLFDNTLSQSVRELLYVPVPAEIKYKGKIFIDMFVNKFATGLGAALFWAFYAVRQFAYRDDGTMARALVVVRETGFLTIFFLALWLVMTRLVYKKYPDILKRGIQKIHKEGPETLVDVDVGLTLEVFNTIQSAERSSTIYLMNLFNLVRRRNLTPELKALLGVKRDEMKARAMDALFDVGGCGFFPELEEAIADPEIQKEIDLVFLLPAYQKIMEDRLGEIVESAEEVDRIEAAGTIRRMYPNESTLQALGRLLQDPSPEVVTYALESAAVHRSPDHVPSILRLLANPMVRAEAQRTLAAYGPGVEGLIGPALQLESEPLEVRRAVPEVLAQVGTQRAADILLAELARRSDDMEQALVAALYRIRADRPSVRFREKAVRPEVLFLVRRACDVVLAPPGPPDEAAAVLNIRIKRVFDLMTLLYPREDVVKAFQNIHLGSARSADYSLESLEVLLDRDRELKALLLPLVEKELSLEEKAHRLRKALRLK
jgi:AAA family ATP:ADP antiporter